MLAELQRRLMERMKRQTLPTRMLLSRFYFPDEDLRKKPEYVDNAWMPFWYYLGLEERPKKLLDVGSRLGLEAACCVLGAKTPMLVSIHKRRSRFTSSNLRLLGAEIEFDCGGDWDLAIVDGDFLDGLDFIWDRMKLGSLLCVIAGEMALRDFARTKNRTPVFCKLRHSVGLLRK